MITKSGWTAFCYPPLAKVQEGFIAHEFKARMSIPANGTLYAKSINIHILCHISKL